MWEQLQLPIEALGKNLLLNFIKLDGVRKLLTQYLQLYMIIVGLKA